MRPGIYYGNARGMNAAVVVRLVVEEGDKIGMEVVSNTETPGLGDILLDRNGEEVSTIIGKIPVKAIPEAILKHRSTNIAPLKGARVTSAAVIKAAREALFQAGADLSVWDSGERIVIGAEDEMPVREADVVVIGGGGAGLIAAIRAADLGAKVIVLEKSDQIGGDLLICGGTINAIDPASQGKADTLNAAQLETIEELLSEQPISKEHAALIEEVKEDYQKYALEKKGVFDSPAWYTLQTWTGGDRIGDLSLIRTMAERSCDAFAWLQNLGMEFSEDVGQGAGSLWKRSHYTKMTGGTGFISAFARALEECEDRVSVYTGMQAKELVAEDGRITGVKACGENGEALWFKAEKGVIIATGGFAANRKMIQQYNDGSKWSDLSKTPTTNRFRVSQGEGIQMAVTVGAGVRDMEQIQLLFLGNMKNGQLTKYTPRCVKALPQTVFVNKNGERFVREDGRRDEICKAILEQPDRMYYVIESADGSFYEDINDPAWRSGDGFTREYLETGGDLFVADTIEELADKISVKRELLKNSIDTYNRYARQKKDPDFGRTCFDAILEHGPYMATPRQTTIHYTMGGLTADNRARVLDTGGNAIPGLYAAGEVIGGIHGGNRLGGNAITDMVVYGMISAESAVM